MNIEAAPRVPRTPIAGPTAWTRDSLGPTPGRLAPSAGCLDALRDSVARLRANPMPMLALRPDDFELAPCLPLAAAIREALNTGAGPGGGIGFVIVERLPVEEWSVDEARAVYWLLGQIVGRPVAQSWDGKMLYDVLDSGRPPGNGVRPDRTNARQNFHTDNSYNNCPPRAVGLLCLETSAEGGLHSVVSFHTAHNAMLKRHPDLLDRLYENYCFDRQREHAPGDAMVVWHPMLEYDGRELTARLSLRQVQAGHELAGVPIDARGQAALDAFEAILEDGALHHDIGFAPGRLLFVNNRHLGHRRAAFSDAGDKRRHLLRLWLRESGRRFYNG